MSIAVIEWSRRDEAARDERQQFNEALAHEQRRDRAVDETVSSALREWQHGNTVTVGGSIGLGGTGGGASVAAGGSWSESRGGRQLDASTLQSLADSINQASTATRDLMSTVVVQASQAETETLTTRTVRNHNHCHALTLLYYEVLRQYRVRVRMASAKDVLLLKTDEPTTFDSSTALVYRAFLQEHLLEPNLRGCFDAIARRQYEAAAIASVGASSSGGRRIHRLYVYVANALPSDGVSVDHADYASLYFLLRRRDSPNPLRWNHAGNGLPADGAPSMADLDPNPTALAEEPAPVLPPLTLEAITQVGIDSSGNAYPGGRHGDEWHLGRLRVEYTLEGENVQRVLFDSNDSSFGVPAFPLPYYFKTGGAAWWSPRLTTRTSEPAPHLDTDTRAVDEVCKRQLLDHLNAHQMYYRRLVWLGMDPGEYARMFDGISYGSGTLLDVAQPTPLAVIGPYIVFPLASAEATFARRLRERAQIPAEPIETSVSLPTRGVFAEAKLGHCNSCEELDVTRFWDWSESPCPDTAPAISGVVPGSRARDVSTTPSPLPNPVVNIVNPAPVPDPVGLAAAMNVMGTPNIFRDMSGRQEVSSLLQRLSDGTVSFDQARQEARRLQSAAQVSERSADSHVTPRVASARDLHDYHQVVRNGVARGDLTEAQGRALIERSSRTQIAGNVEETGPGIYETGPIELEPTNPLLLPLPEPDRWYRSWLLLYNFDVNGWELKPEHTDRLDRHVQILRFMGAYRVEVIQGRASETGHERNEEHNRHLSNMRQLTVRNYLLEQGLEAAHVTAVQDPPLGSSDPLRVREGYPEDEVNRSVLVYFHFLIPSVRIPPPPPPPPSTEPTTRLSREWALRVVAVGSMHAEIGRSLAQVHIKNCRTGEVGVFQLEGVGVGVDIGLSIHLPHWTAFRTIFPTDLDYFNHRFGFFYTVGASVFGAEYSEGYVRLPWLVEDAIHVAGLGVAAHPHPLVDIGGYIDVIEVLAWPPERFNDPSPCPALE